MIKAILFTVGFLVLAAVVGIAIWQGIKYAKRIRFTQADNMSSR